MTPLELLEPSAPPSRGAAERFASYRFWERYKSDELAAIRAKLNAVLDDRERQYDLFGSPVETPAPVSERAVVSGEASAPQSANGLGELLSPAQLNTFLNCSARWWFKYGEQLPDPASGSLVRGRVVHKIAAACFRARLEGRMPADLDDFADYFESCWDAEAERASFHKDDDIELLKRQAAVLARKYVEEAAHEIEPAAIETRVSGAIAGVAVQGFLDVLDTAGRIIDLKTAARKPTAISSDYAVQVATYTALEPRASGAARLDTLVATKTPQLVTLSYTVSAADRLAIERLYPLVREGIREGLYFPNRGSNLCSRKTCNFCDACTREFGGAVRRRRGVTRRLRAKLLWAAGIAAYAAVTLLAAYGYLDGWIDQIISSGASGR